MEQIGASPKPPAVVIVGPAGSGKTATCIERLKAQPARSLLAVPSARYAERLREIYPDAPGEAILPFGALVTRLAGVEPTNLATPAFRRLALAEAVNRDVTREAYFGAMRDVPGFSRALAEIISELKLSCVTPEILLQSAETAVHELGNRAFLRKAEEISKVFSTYNSLLAEHSLLDADDVVAAATSRVVARKPLPGRLKTLHVDGFHRLSLAWRRLLAALSARGVQVTVTLTYEDDRPLLFAATARTLQSLRSEFTVTEEPLPARHADTHSPLNTLERRIWAPSLGAAVGAGRRPGPDSALTIHDSRLTTPESGPEHLNTRTPEHPADSGPSPLTSHLSPESPHHPPLLLFDAPNAYAECEMVARALRREREATACAWSDYAVVLRSPAEYAPTLRSVFEKLGVPVALPPVERLIDSRTVRSLALLGRVFLSGWQRDEVVALLKCALAGERLAVDTLFSRARKQAVREGREAWLRLAGRKGTEAASRLLARVAELEMGFDGPGRHASELAQRLRQAAGELGLHDEDGSLRYALRIADEVAAAAGLIGSGKMDFRTFYSAVSAAWSGASYSPPAPRDAVRVSDPYDIREARPRIAAVMGLIERGFPRRVAEDPFLRDDERIALAAAGLVGLEQRSERADEERLLFYLAVTAPSERLILSFPRAGDESDTLPSFFLDEVHAALGRVPAVVRTLADVAPIPEECTSSRDHLLAACAALGEAGQVEDGPDRAAVAEVLATRGRPRLPRLERPELKSVYGATRRFGVTEIETYNTCPFRHWMQYGMDARPEADGAGPADRGALYHRALSRHHRKSPSPSEETDPVDVDALCRSLIEELSDCLSAASVDARPHRRMLLERYLTEALAAFARREALLRPRFGLAPTHFELAFGMDSAAADEEGEPGREYDAASTGAPLVITPPDGGGPIHLAGAIDRVDLTPDGSRALLMDYKTGATATYRQMSEGQSLQLPLYFLALEQLWGKEALGACYDSPQDAGRRRFFLQDRAEIKRFGLVTGVESGAEMVKPVNPTEHEQTMRAVVEAVARAVRGILSAAILPTPGLHCAHCDYGDCCRTSLDHSHDGEPFELMVDG